MNKVGSHVSSLMFGECLDVDMIYDKKVGSRFRQWCVWIAAPDGCLSLPF
jgi:hypothetical protein